MNTKTISFGLPIMDGNNKHFTDLHIQASITTQGDRISGIEINKVMYFSNGSSIGSDLNDLILICAPELLDGIKAAAKNNFKNTV